MTGTFSDFANRFRDKSGKGMFIADIWAFGVGKGVGGKSKKRHISTNIVEDLPKMRHLEHWLREIVAFSYAIPIALSAFS